jgi:hypothetical protein
VKETLAVYARGLVGMVLTGLAVFVAFVFYVAVARGGDYSTDVLTRDAPRAPAAVPRNAGTGIPALDDLLREAKRQGAPVVRQFNEDGVGLVWFKATPDGWLSKVPPPVVPTRVAPPPVQYQPRPEVAVPQAPFPGSGIPYHAGHDCPVCGRSQYVIERQLPNGEHVHRCSAGHAWRHRS